MTDEEKEKVKKLFGETTQHYNNKEYEKVIKCLEQIIELNPDYANAI